MLRQSFRVLGFLCCLVAMALLAAAIGAPSVAHAATVHISHANAIAFLPSAAIGVAGMISIPWDPPLSRGDLERIVNPSSANQPEVVSGYPLYDTQDIANAASGPFQFFTTLSNDRTITNMQSAGQLPEPQYFQIFYIAADFLQIPTATALANEPNQALANVENILKTCRAIVTLTLSDKPYGPWPLTMAHSTGGATFSGYAYGTAANGTSSGVVNNGIPGTGGIAIGGSIVIPPKQAFNVTVTLGTGVTATVSATLKLRLSLVGNFYRRVL